MTDSTDTGRPRRTQRDEQREASRARLVEAAVAVLAEEGYGGLTVKRVGDRAGVSRGMVNYHFASKAGLVEAVVADVREGFAERVRSVPGYAAMNGLDAVVTRVDRYFARLAGPESGVRARALLALLTEAASGPVDLEATMAGHLDLVRSAIEADIRRGTADGSVRADCDPAAQAFLIESLARGVLLQGQMESAAGLLPRVRAAARETVRRSLAV